MNKPPAPRTGKTSKSPPVAATAKAKSRKKTTVSKRASSSRTGEHSPVDGDMRRAMIAQAAYFRAEKRGFVRGGELDDWLEAEREISSVLDD